MVTHYYRKVAIYYSQKMIARKELEQIWEKEDLRIIDKILYPVESVALTTFFGTRPDTANRLKQLYDNWPTKSR